jgi:uncharacterized protein (TIGR03118 family)
MAVEIALMESLENRQLLSVPFFIQKNLVSDTAATPAAHHDANLVNPWGLAATSNGPWWVANNGTGTSTAYMGNGSSIGYTVKIPGADGVAGHGKPTGIVANATNGFVITKGATSMPAEYVFVGEDGVISGWNIGVDANNAISMVNVPADGAIYKGATMGVSGGNTFLYAADFHNGKINVFDNTFAKSTAFAGKFADTKLPAGYAPFNISNVGGKLYVAFAQQDAAKHDEVAGAGKGFVDVFTTAGNLVRRLTHGTFMDAPWAMTKAPKGFGKFGNSILVGNFGSGKIAAFSGKNGKFKGFLSNRRGKAIVINGLWGLAFGNNAQAGSSKTLFFAAGIGDEAHGLFGTLRPA